MAPNVEYLASSAHIFGVAIVTGVSSLPDKPRTLLIEAAFWNGGVPILGLFRYFNGVPGIAFQEQEKYFIHSTVSFGVT